MKKIKLFIQANILFLNKFWSIYSYGRTFMKHHTSQLYNFWIFNYIILWLFQSTQGNVKWHTNTYCGIKKILHERYPPHIELILKRVINVCICLHKVERVHYHIHFNVLLVCVRKMNNGHVRYVHKELCQLQDCLIANRVTVVYILCNVLCRVQCDLNL